MTHTIEEILAEIRLLEKRLGRAYQPLDWLWNLDTAGRSFPTIREILLSRLIESRRDAWKFATESNILPDGLIDAPWQINHLIDACLPFAAEMVLLRTEQIARQMGDGSYRAKLALALRAAAHIHRISNPVTVRVLATLPEPTPLVIAERIEMSLLGVTFVVKGLLRLPRGDPDADILLDRILEYVRGLPMEPERNAAAAYRYVLLGGMRTNEHGLPVLESDDRQGRVATSWFYDRLRQAVEEAGWKFTVPELVEGEWRAIVLDGNDFHFFLHRIEGWRKEELAVGEEVLLPASPPRGIPRRQVEDEEAFLLQFHPATVPTPAMLQRVPAEPGPEPSEST